MSIDGSPLLTIPPPRYLRDRPIKEWGSTEQSLFNRVTVAVQALDVNRLRGLRKEILRHEEDEDEVFLSQEDWDECVKVAIRNVEAYMEMVHTPNERLRQAEMAHELQLKDKEIELRKLELQLEQARAERDEQDRQATRDHELRKRRLDSVDATLKAVILAQAEFRDNPLAEELVGRFRGIYDTLDKMGYQVELDEDAMTDLIEQIALRHFTTKTGIAIE